METGSVEITSASSVHPAGRAPRPALPPTAFIGRQGIFDADQRLVAYELLYRCSADNQARFVDGGAATAEVVIAAFMDIGFERIVARHRAFINVPRSFFESEELLMLPPDRVVLEVLEDTRVDPAFVERVRYARDHGFTIALDDYVDEPSWKPLLDLASIVKFDVRSLGLDGVREQLGSIGPARHMQLLAEKVETHEEFGVLAGMGFTLFQGRFLEKPRVLSGRRLPASKLALLRLVALLQDPEVSPERVAEVVSQDVTLSYRLLRFMNSAFFNPAREITSIRRAIIAFGLGSLKRWATLMSLARLGDDKPEELIRVALVRARMCELVCATLGGQESALGFTVGLFSVLDALLDTAMDELLAGLDLADGVKDAILHQAGVAGAALCWARAVERGESASIASGQALDDGRVAIYVQSLIWADEVMAPVSRAD